MSHFTVMVVTDREPTDDVLTEALAPFHEFECTEHSDQYVQEVDETEEMREEYADHTVSRIRMPDGLLRSPSDDAFYRDPTPEEARIVGLGSGCSGALSWHSQDWGDGRGYRTRVRFVPEGCTEVDVPAVEVFTFAEFVAYWTDRQVVPFGERPDIEKTHMYGWVEVDEGGDVTRVVRRTNPNKKWDWWQVGGRWDGFLRMKAGGKADSAAKRDVDFDGIRDEEGRRAGEKWDTIRAIVGDLSTFIPWADLVTRHGGDYAAARAEYHAQPAVKALRAGGVKFAFDSVESFTMPREQHVDHARKTACQTFAFLRDGQWAEKGEMGWFACVSDEKADWPTIFEGLLADVPDDHWLTVVDCHI